MLRSPGVLWNIATDGNQQTAHAIVEPSKGDVVLELRCGTEEIGPSEVPELERRATSEAYWSDWAKTLELPKLKPDLMKRSALTLRGLVHADSGSIHGRRHNIPCRRRSAEVRNWDYRYCWLRDAALTATALVSVGSTDEAENYLDWVHRVLETLPGPERLHPLYNALRDLATARGRHRFTSRIRRFPGRSASETPRISRFNWTCSARSSN